MRHYKVENHRGEHIHLMAESEPSAVERALPTLRRLYGRGILRSDLTVTDVTDEPEPEDPFGRGDDAGALVRSVRKQREEGVG